MFTFERLLNIRLEIFKLAKKCIVNNLSSYWLMTGRVQRKGISFDEIRLRVLHWYDLLLSVIKSYEEFLGTSIDFSEGGYQMNGLEHLQRLV